MKPARAKRGVLGEERAGACLFSGRAAILRETTNAEGRVLYKIPLVLAPQPEGGYTVTSPLLPELVTEGDTTEEVLANVKDALEAVIEAYHDLGRTLPPSLQHDDRSGPLWIETVVSVP
jgi:antitoxin HicB